MRKFLLSRRGKSIVTTLLLIGTIFSHTKPEMTSANTNAIGSSHCVITTLWFLCTILHIWQHWPLIKALRNRRVAARNRITTIVTLCFLLMAASIITLNLGLGGNTILFHRAVAHLYIPIVVLHAATKFSRFRSLALR